MVRGTFLSDTVRCESGVPNRVPSYATPGYFQHSILIQCYADVRANSYIVGTGPAQLTVLVSYWHYWDGYYVGGVGQLGFESEEEIVEALRTTFVLTLTEGPGGTGGGIYGREVVLFLGPSHSHATEVWEVIEAWDVQRQQDGTVFVVHPGRDAWRQTRPDDYQTHRSVLEMALTTFAQAARAASTARNTEYGGRIAPTNIEGIAAGVDLPMLVTDANQLSQFYTDTGAYDHPHGPPAQPPPPCGLAVSNQTDNPGLMRDCMTLLAAKDTLRGTAALNWSVDVAIGSWEGVTMSGTPSRVTELDLSGESLSGTIPAELGTLFELTDLDLSSNSLTGSIPRELGWLLNLEELRLSGNSLTGCIPVGLQDVATNDLSSLNLLYCAPPPENLTAGTVT